MFVLILGVLGIAAWLAFMSFAILLPFRPDVVRIAERLVCPPGTRMVVRMGVYTYHRSGQRAIEIYCQNEDGTETSIQARTLVTLWCIFFIISLPLSAVLVWVFSGLLQ